MKKILLIILLLTICNNIFSQVQEYLTYPDRKRLYFLTETELIWKGYPDYTYHYTLRNDTLFIKEKNAAWNSRQMAIKKGEYILYYSNLDENYPPYLLRLESPEFKEEHHNIFIKTKLETKALMYDLYERIKILEIFDTTYNYPLPEIKIPYF